MNRLLLALVALTTALVFVQAAPCSVEDQANRCLWGFVQSLALRDQLPVNIKSVLLRAFADRLVSGRCGKDLPSEEVLNEFEKAVEDKLIPSCVVEVLRSVRRCEDDPEPTSVATSSSTLAPPPPTTTTALPLSTIVSSSSTVAPSSTASSTPSETIDASEDSPKYGLDDFGGEFGRNNTNRRKRTNWIPTYLQRIYRELGDEGSSSVRLALFRAQSDFNALVASGGDLAGFIPDYLSEFSPAAAEAFESIREMYIIGQEGDYEFVMPPAIKNLVNESNAQGRLIPWEIVDAWKNVYSGAYNNRWKVADIIGDRLEGHLRSGIITQEEFELYTSSSVIEQLELGVAQDRESTGRKFSGINDDLLNPLYAARKAAGLNDNPIDELRKALIDLTSKHQKGLDISEYTPAWLLKNLAKNLSPEEVEQYVKVYEKMRTRRIMKYGNPLPLPAPKPTGSSTTKTITEWYKPDERLRKPYDDLMNQGLMNSSVFNALKNWTSAIVNFVNSNGSLDGYDEFIPPSFEADLNKLSSSVEDQQAYRAAFENIRALVKGFIQVVDP